MLIKIIKNEKTLFEFTTGLFPYMIGDVVTFDNGQSYLIKAITKRNNNLKVIVDEYK